MNATRKTYAIVGVESSAPWPASETAIEFRGLELLLRPPEGDRASSVVVAYEAPATHDQVVREVNEFLSSWAWVSGAKLEVGLISGGGTPHHVGRTRSYSPVRQDFDLQYLPDSKDPKARLALAFYREALNLENIAYKFLSLFKIINILHEGGPAQKIWIRNSLPHLHDSAAQSRISDLIGQGIDVAEYLWASGRCAVAHAFSSPLVNPEDPTDSKRLHADLVVIKALAEHLIEVEFGVKSTQTIWAEHLYELAGFRDLLGDNLVQRLKSSDDVTIKEIPELPRVTVNIYKGPTLKAFSSMDVRVLAIENGIVFLEAIAAGGLSGVILGLNFRAERLVFDPEKYTFVVNRNNLASAQNFIDKLTLLKGLVLNGQLEVLNAETGTLLGRTDPCIPNNIDSGRTLDAIEQKIQYLQEEIAWYLRFGAAS